MRGRRHLRGEPQHQQHECLRVCMRVLRVQQSARPRWPRSWLMCARPMLHDTGIIVILWSLRLTLALAAAY